MGGAEIHTQVKYDKKISYFVLFRFSPKLLLCVEGKVLWNKANLCFIISLSLQATV